MKYLFALLTLCLTACQWNIETVETTDEYGQAIRYQRRKDNFAREGMYERFHPNGKVAERTIYLNDTINGPREFFYENGQLESVTPMVNGVLEGKYEKFRENGQRYIEQTFVNGQLEGWSLKYYPNGQLEEKVMLKNSEENGPFFEYYDNGKPKAEGNYIYKDEAALEQGELKEYDSTGTLIRIADCIDGICRTRWKKE